MRKLFKDLMDTKNYPCDYNFDWVEKMQKLTNKVLNSFTLVLDDCFNQCLFFYTRMQLVIPKIQYQPNRKYLMQQHDK